MTALSNALAVIDLAHDLAALASSTEYEVRAPELIAELLPADELIWARIDLLAGTATVRGAAAGDDQRRAAALARYGHTHQGLRSYRASPNDRAPRRMSDVATQSQWHRTALYNEMYRPFGHAFQLGLLTQLGAGGIGAGWTFTRVVSDFSDREMGLARRLQPMLIALESARATVVDPPLVSVKPREFVLLTHLAAGLTARAIGHQMGITERTVRKHLGELYVILGCNDRLLAVQRAKDLGLLRR